MKTKMTAKKLSSVLLSMLIFLLIVASLTACSDSNSENPATETQTVAAEITTAVAEVNTDDYATAWNDAEYTEDTVVGEGDTNFYFEVKVGTYSVTFTVNTNETTVGKALLDNGIIAGDDGPYGLYVKTVNGILADYDVNGTYWGFYQNGEYAMNGVDQTDIENGAHYEMVYSK